jgi:hypothetical protein
VPAEIPGGVDDESRARGSPSSNHRALAMSPWTRELRQIRPHEVGEAHREYTLALFRQLARSRAVDPARLRALQGAARRARSDAEASALRLANEPSQPR